MFIHNFDPVLIDFGIFQVRWYSLSYIFGIIIGWIYALKIIKFSVKNVNNFDSVKASQFDNFLIYLVLGIVIGGRLGYVIFYNFEYYFQNFFEIFKIWQGGMSFHGGLFGVVMAAMFFSYKNKIDFFKLTDITACVAPIGIFLGRIANFINGELYGKISTLPWAIIFPNVDNIPRHPSQIYESLLEGLLLFILINYFALKKKILYKPGYISGFFLIFYSIFRIFSENFREPDIHLGYFFQYFSMGTLLSFITIIFGLFIIYIKKNEQNN